MATRNLPQRAPENVPAQADEAMAAWRQKIDLIKRMVARGATDDELELFLYRAKQLGLDPLSGQIHFIKRKQYNPETDRYEEVATIQVGIEGLLVVAQRTGLLGGVKRDVICDEKGRLVAAWAEVIRKDWAEPVREVVYFEEYCQRKKDGSPAGLWAKMPKQQLKKCALAAALRIAFPNELSGVYAPEELDQALNPPPERQADNGNQGSQPQVIPPKPTNGRPAELASEAQRKKIFVMAKELGLTSDDLKEISKRRYGKDSSKELTKAEASDFIEYLTRLENGEEFWPPLEEAELEEAPHELGMEELEELEDFAKALPDEPADAPPDAYEGKLPWD